MGRDGGIGRHKGLKIPRALNPVPVRFWFSAKKATDFSVAFFVLNSVFNQNKFYTLF